MSDVTDRLANIVEQLQNLVLATRYQVPQVNEDSPSVNASSPNCHYNYMRLGDNCYGYFRESLNWSEAQSACSAFRGFLAEPMTQMENLFIAALIQTNSGNIAWLGGHDLVREGQWTWTHSGLRLSGRYQDWAPGEPNNMDNKEHCLDLH